MNDYPVEYDYPEICDVCGNLVDDCVCRPCNICGDVGNPHCYENHNMQYSEIQKQTIMINEENHKLERIKESELVELMLENFDLTSVL